MSPCRRKAVQAGVLEEYILLISSYTSMTVGCGRGAEVCLSRKSAEGGQQGFVLAFYWDDEHETRMNVQSPTRLGPVLRVTKVGDIFVRMYNIIVLVYSFLQICAYHNTFLCNEAQMSNSLSLTANMPSKLAKERERNEKGEEPWFLFSPWFV